MYLLSLVRYGLVATCVCLPSALLADATQQLPSVLVVQTTAELRRAGPNGTEFVPAERVRIGDEILYTLRVRNTGDTSVQDALVVKSVPRNTRYVAGSAVGPAATVAYSIDGGKTFGTVDNLVVNAADGTQRQATPDDYTHIRWQLRHPLAAGATALLRFRSVLR